MNETTQRWILIGSFAGITVLFYTLVALHFGYTPDDTYIYLQYAKHIVQGGGISFNAGEPTYGFTSPLWLALLVLGGKAGLDLYVVAKILDLLFACCSLFVFYLLVHEVTRNHLVALLATFALSMHAWFLRWSSTGMETSLGVCLMLTVVYYVLKNDYLIAVIALALLTHVRPEAALLIIPMIIDVFVNTYARRQAYRTIIRSAIVYVIMVVPWMIYSYLTFSTVVANTTKAKSSLEFNIPEMTKGAIQIFQILAATDAISIACLLFFGIMLLLFFQKNRGVQSLKEEKFYLFRQNLVSLLWIVGLPALYIITRANMTSRYLMIVIPFILLLVYSVTYAYMKIVKSQRLTLPVLAVLTLLIVVENQYVYWRVAKPGIEAFSEGMQSSLIPIGQWLKNNTKSDDVIFAWDIGAMGYYSDRNICDGFGLATPAIIPLIHAGFTPDRMMEEKIYRSACRADYVVHRSTTPEPWKGYDKLIPVLTKPFHQMGLRSDSTQYFTVYKVIKDTAY